MVRAQRDDHDGHLQLHVKGMSTFLFKLNEMQILFALGRNGHHSSYWEGMKVTSFTLRRRGHLLGFDGRWPPLHCNTYEIYSVCTVSNQYMYLKVKEIGHTPPQSGGGHHHTLPIESDDGHFPHGGQDVHRLQFEKEVHIPLTFTGRWPTCLPIEHI